MVMMTNEGSSKNVNFMTPGTGVLMLECGHIIHIMMLSYAIVDFYLFYDGSVDLQICMSPSDEVSVESLMLR